MSQGGRLCLVLEANEVGRAVKMTSVLPRRGIDDHEQRIRVIEAR